MRFTPLNDEQLNALRPELICPDVDFIIKKAEDTTAKRSGNPMLVIFFQV